MNKYVACLKGECHVRHTVSVARETGEGYPAAANAVIIGINFPYLS
jgi:hypothetical protein